MSRCNRCGEEIAWARDVDTWRWIAIEPWSIDDELDIPYASGIHLRPEHVLHHAACSAGNRGAEKGRARNTKTSRAQTPESADPWAALWLAKGAPREVVTAAYRALARIHHPDVGGSEEQMKKINDAYENLTRKRRAVAL